MNKKKTHSTLHDLWPDIPVITMGKQLRKRAYIIVSLTESEFGDLLRKRRKKSKAKRRK